MAANIRCIMRAKAPYGQGITKMKVKLTPEQSSTPSLMPETESVYLRRATEGTGELMELVGGTVAWNQLLQATNIPATYSKFGLTFTRKNTGIGYTVSGTFQAVSDRNAYLYVGSPIITITQGHKYLFLCSSKYGNVYAFGLNWSGNRTTLPPTGGNILQADESGNLNFAVNYRLVEDGATINDNVDLAIVDLTQFFNPTIADYVYSLEQATAGSGIAWLKKYGLIDDQYHAHSAPTLQSVEASAHVTVGFNQWDEEWELGSFNVSTGAAVSSADRIRSKNYIPIFPTTAYYFMTKTVANNMWANVLFYDASYNYLGYKGAYSPSSTTNPNYGNPFTTPANARYAKFVMNATYGTDYNDDVCLNISKPTGAPKNGDYVPYVKRTYPTSPVILRGILKTDENGNLYYYGDEYLPDGTVNRRFAEIDLGNYDWNIAADGGEHERYTLSIPSMVKGSPLVVDRGFTTVASYADVYNHSVDNSIIAHPNATQIEMWASAFVNYTGTQIKAALAGVKLVYELATPTTESADPFTAVQTVEDGGTEEFVTTNGVPVGVVGRFANAVPMEGVDSFTVTADDGTTHSYPVTLSEEIYRGYVDMLTGEAVSDMASIAEYNGETISEPWLSSLDVYAPGATPTKGAQVVYPITPEEVTATITGDPTELSNVVSVSSTEGTVDWGELSEIGIKCIMKRKNPFQ